MKTASKLRQHMCGELRGPLHGGGGKSKEGEHGGLNREFIGRGEGRGRDSGQQTKRHAPRSKYAQTA